jgi:uncharacterized cupin superfamily protein
MPNESFPPAIEATSAPARVPMFAFPEPLASLMRDRSRHPLGTHFGLTNFGVNLTRLPPGCVSAPRHAHSHQDEFVYILQGTPVLVTNAGEMQLHAGMCAGFKAGNGDAHQLRNESQTVVMYLEIGDRTVGDGVTYPDDDIKIIATPDGRAQIVRKDGSPI